MCLVNAAYLKIIKIIIGGVQKVQMLVTLKNKKIKNFKIEIKPQY